MAANYFSPDYFVARRRFLSAVERLGLEHRALPINANSPTGESLTIDVAIVGSHMPSSALILTSGMHGVEGFFGSAVQLAVLDRLAPDWRPPDGAAMILLHALNPYGFAWRRRFNEDNVDLNRNFLLPDQPFAGAPPLSGAFRRVMAPQRPPTRLGLYSAKMAYLALRHGIRAFWETLPVGQYDYPDWLYFGGHQLTQTAHAVDQLLSSLLVGTDEVVHLDYHTGLGKWAGYKLLLGESDTAADIAWWQSKFPAERVVEPANLGRYRVRGGFGPWLKARFSDCRYRFATAEFGTYSPLRVTRALIDELRWHTKAGETQPDHWSRHQLAEAFAPRNHHWRRMTVEAGVKLVDRAATALWPESGAGGSMFVDD